LSVAFAAVKLRLEGDVRARLGGEGSEGVGSRDDLP
jgi:hypothetical protein